MAKKGLHPVMHMMKVVLKNGATINYPTTIPRNIPYVLQKDFTNHPAWTGETGGLNMEEGRMARFLARFEGFDLHGEKDGAPAAAAAAGGGTAGKAGAGKGGKNK